MAATSISDDLPVEKLQTHVPPLNELSRVLDSGLKKSFSEVSVSVVDCPDLSQEPYCLTAPGLSGRPCLLDIGGPPYLIPLVNRDKIYNMQTISKQIGRPDSCLIGAGAGPFHLIGTNSEMVCNVNLSKTNGGTWNKSRFFTVNPQNGVYREAPRCCSTECGLLANLFCSEGKPGKVMEIVVSRRTSDAGDILDILIDLLKEHYGEKPIALGGMVFIEKGKVWIHVMPDFSSTPLNCDREVDNWLQFCEISAPVVCLGELVSHDPGLDLRTKHFHCFDKDGNGGHYHYDTTPEEVVYRAYLNVAELVYRIDKPPVTHMMGRD